MAVVVLVVVIAALALLIRPYFRMKRERTEQLQVVAGQHGWTFVKTATVDAIPGWEGFELFGQGHSRTIENLISGEADGIKVAVFDYHFVRKSAEEGQGAQAQTVLCLQHDNLSIPHFSLQPENVLHKIFARYGYQDIDFGQRPAFSSQYLLRGEDERAVRSTFNDRLLSFYEMNPGTCTEGRGDQLFVYRDSRLVEPTQIQSFVDLGLNILKLLPRQN